MTGGVASSDVTEDSVDPPLIDSSDSPAAADESPASLFAQSSSELPGLGATLRRFDDLRRPSRALVGLAELDNWMGMQVILLVILKQ
jgi:hypothetical protein